VAIDSKEKRVAVIGVGRPWARDIFPVATPDEEWRINVGLAYGGNALSPPAGAFEPAWAAKVNTLIGGGINV
jgi:hypothetical protein